MYHRGFSSPEHSSSLLSKQVDSGTYALQTFSHWYHAHRHLSLSILTRIIDPFFQPALA